jgi:hypothetical protein
VANEHKSGNAINLESHAEQTRSGRTVVGDAVGTIETATGAAGTRVQQGLSEAATVITESSAAGRMEKKTRPIRRAAAKKAARIKKTARKRATTATRKASAAKKTARKRATTAARKASAAKKTARKRATTAARKASGAKKTARKQFRAQP